MSEDEKEPGDFKIGMVLGRIESALTVSNDRSQRIEAQHLQLVNQTTDMRRELQKFATDLVDQRAAMSARLDALELNNRLGPMRPPSHSVTNEVARDARESMRVTAEGLKEVKEINVAQSAMLGEALGQAPALAKATSRTTVASIALAIAAFFGAAKVILDMVAPVLAHH